MMGNENQKKQGYPLNRKKITAYVRNCLKWFCFPQIAQMNADKLVF